MASPEPDLAHLARLARLALDPAELASLGADLRKILDYVAQLEALDLTGVAPMVHPLPFEAPFRADAPAPPLDREVALAASAQHDGQSFIVPRVL
ncbi:MAG: Asp-tRNA(Asn)/Glu-tRNA(Gln) amidotransferase subunit GatC [Myxococcota bacterium]